MRVRIRYCSLCGYKTRAHALGDELRERFDAEVEVSEGKFGQFDVFVGETLVASRGKSFLARMLPKDAPKSDEIISSIEAHWAPRDGESCEVPSSS